MLMLISPDRIPAQLRGIANPPTQLYCRGELLPSDWRAVAIIGARRPLHSAAQVRAERVAYLAVAQGFCVIAGLAQGVDSWAHQAALDAGGRTVAVLAGGVGIVAEGVSSLAPRMERQGALISERSPYYRPQAPDFPLRNRLITGIAALVIVIDADVRGGTMRAVEYAQAQGRPIFALPGSAGCDQFIARGWAQAIATPSELRTHLRGL